MDNYSIRTYEEHIVISKHMSDDFNELVKYLFKTEKAKDSNLDIILNYAEKAKIPKHMLTGIIKHFELVETDFDAFRENLHIVISKLMNDFINWEVLEANSIR